MRIYCGYKQLKEKAQIKHKIIVLIHNTLSFSIPLVVIFEH